MEKILISCPECKTKLSIPDIPGISDKIIVCPKCKFKAKVNVYIAGCSARGGQGADDDATQLPSTSKIKLPQEPGVLRCLSDGSCFNLHIGHNTIGRSSSANLSEIQISGDPYMSRKHVDINVVKSPAGLEYHLIEINSMNIVLLNGEAIDRGDIIKLVYGDILTCGKTRLRLEDHSI